MAYAAENTRLYGNDFDYDMALQQRVNDQSSQILVIDGDCLETVLCFKDKYPRSNPVVLNMASKRNPGGGWKTGPYILIYL
jgi:hypothetical protein